MLLSDTVGAAASVASGNGVTEALTADLIVVAEVLVATSPIFVGVVILQASVRTIPKSRVEVMRNLLFIDVFLCLMSVFNRC
jgi:hypothetical protein